MPPSDILLATLNAKFIHCAFGLRYLFANLGELQSRAALVEFEIQQRPLEVVEALLARKPRIIGLGVYIWSKSMGLTIVIMISMVLSMAIASVSGALIPIMLTVSGQDPAQSSSIFLTTVTDIAGFFSFLGIATLFMHML